MKKTIILIISLLLIIQLSAQNRALGKACNSSSVNGAENCSKAVDGVQTAGSKWVSNGASAQSWLSVDLGQNYNLTSVRLVNAGAVGENTQYNTKAFRIETQNSDGSWATRATIDNATSQNIITVNLQASARNIRLYITQPNYNVDAYSRIAEFEVYGNVQSTATAPCAGNLNLNGTVSGNNICSGTLTATNIVTSGNVTLIAPTVSITGSATISSGCNIRAGTCAASTDPCFVTRSGNTFSYKGGEYRFIGVNMRGIHYKANNVIDEQLRSAAQMGVKVVRIFLPDKNLSREAIGDKLQNFLNRISAVAPAIKVILSLTNYYGDNDFRPAGDDGYYCNGTLCASWFTGGYKVNYLPYAGYMATRFKTDNRIFAWEIGNELKAGNAADMLNFAYDAGWYLRGAGVAQMISTGFIGVNHACNGGVNSDLIRQMYIDRGSNNPSPFSFGSIHAYNNEQADPGASSCVRNPQWQFHDINWFVANGYPYIVGEAGFDGALTTSTTCPHLYNYDCNWEGLSIPNASGNRKAALMATVDKFFNDKSCDGFMQWGFVAGGNNGEGDKCSGMDTYSHSDWNDLWQVYSSKASSLPSGGTSCSAAPIAAGNVFAESAPVTPIPLTSEFSFSTISASPNPFGNEIKLNLNGVTRQHITIWLYNSQGKMVLKKNVLAAANSTVTLDTRQLPGGTYFCIVNGTQNEVLFRGTMVKQ